MRCPATSAQAAQAVIVSLSEPAGARSAPMSANAVNATGGHDGLFDTYSARMCSWLDAANSAALTVAAAGMSSPCKTQPTALVAPV